MNTDDRIAWERKCKLAYECAESALAAVLAEESGVSQQQSDAESA